MASVWREPTRLISKDAPVPWMHTYPKKERKKERLERKKGETIPRLAWHSDWIAEGNAGTQHASLSPSLEEGRSLAFRFRTTLDNQNTRKRESFCFMTQLVIHGPSPRQLCFIGPSRYLSKLPCEIVLA
jgi:hypothetical protein